MPRERAFFDGPRPVLLGKITTEEVAILTSGGKRTRKVRLLGCFPLSGLGRPGIMNASGLFSGAAPISHSGIGVCCMAASEHRYTRAPLGRYNAA
jgi:hypothetical protein